MDIGDMKKEARSRQLKNRSLIHDAFPAQGQPQPSHMGSQSMTPDQQLLGPMPPQMPSDSATGMSPQGEY
jgi:hypothetical protein